MHRRKKYNKSKIILPHSKQFKKYKKTHRRERVPKNWDVGIVLTLKNNRKCCNYRRLTLLSATPKVYKRILEGKNKNRTPSN